MNLEEQIDYPSTDQSAYSFPSSCMDHPFEISFTY